VPVTGEILCKEGLRCARQCLIAYAATAVSLLLDASGLGWLKEPSIGIYGY